MSFPVLLSGNEITDAVRTAALQGDGRLPESSVGIWEATTNLILNGGIETNDTGWTDVSATGSRVTTQQKFGLASLEIVTANATANEGCYHNFTATVAVYTVSAWVRGSGGTVRMAVRDNAGANPQTGTAVTLTPDWQRITLTTTNLTAATWRCYVETSAQQNITFQADGMQAELQPIATPYVETNGSTASRTVSRVRLPMGPLGPMNDTQGWLAVRFRVNYGSATLPDTDPEFFKWANTDGLNALRLFWSSGTNQWTFGRYGGSQDDVASAITSFVSGDFITLIGTWVAASITISLNGAAFVSAGNVQNPWGTNPDYATVGSRVDQARMSDSDFFWVALGTGTLTNNDAANIHASGNTARRCEDFPGTCVMVWPADTDFGITPGDLLPTGPVSLRVGKGSAW